MRQYCHNCNFNGAVKLGPLLKTLVFCLRNDGWRRYNYSCGYWELNDPKLSRYERLKLADYYNSKNKRYEKCFQDIAHSGLVSILGSITIVTLVIMTGIVSCVICSILK